jgi:hypothetical protein
MKTIAIGPEKDIPSWNWVGFDLSRELSKYYNVKVFRKYQEISDPELCIFIKEPCPSNLLWNLKRQKTKLIYFPIDYYQNYQSINESKYFLSQYDAIFAHSKRLLKLLKPINPKSFYIEHNNKFALKDIAEYKENGYVIWVGGYEHLIHLINYLQNNSLDLNIKALTNYNNPNSLRAAENAGLTSIPDNIELYEWSESLQYIMMQNAKAAIDIKGNNFSQYTKPPTKAQKYISSGIPFACNHDASAIEYFAAMNFQITEPKDTMRWFSREYYDETIMITKRLKHTLDLETIGNYLHEKISRII